MYSYMHTTFKPHGNVAIWHLLIEDVLPTVSNEVHRLHLTCPAKFTITYHLSKITYHLSSRVHLLHHTCPAEFTDTLHQEEGGGLGVRNDVVKVAPAVSATAGTQDDVRGHSG